MSEIADVAVDHGGSRRWPAWAERMVSVAVVADDRPDRAQAKRIFTAAMWGSILTTSISFAQMIVIDAPWAAAAMAAPIAAAAISLFALWRRPGAFPGVMHLVSGGTLITGVAMIVLFGGVDATAGNAIWCLLVVVGGVAIFADRRAHIWLGVFVVSILAASLIAEGVEPLYELPNQVPVALFNLIAVTVFLYAVLYYFVRQTGLLYRQSEGLLRNILPEKIADRLKRSDGMIADEFESASILFADVVGFTPLVTAMETSEVIELLNDVFTVFDDMVLERGLEKIKTIGDAYMVAGGVPVVRDDHAQVVCELALAMQHHIRSHEFLGHRLEMRIGISSGAVMAGIIGHQKFSYDLWGATVNLASRMESTGEPGKIQVTAATHDLALPRFTFQERGLVDIKGQGPTPTWYLMGETFGA